MEQDALQSRIFIPYIFTTLAFENISGLLMRWFYESCFHKSVIVYFFHDFFCHF